jgi:hypothetical protein
MGVDTHVLLDGYVDVQEIVEWVAVTTLSHVRVERGLVDDMVQICFDYRDEQRMLSVFTNGNCRNDYADTTTELMTLITFGCWGSNEEIANSLLDRFGGYYDYNDCDDVDYQRREKTVDYVT